MRLIRIRKGYDFHCHLRTGRVLNSVIAFTAQQFKGAVVMPDTAPPILNAQNVSRYRREITDITSFFEPLMTIQINEETTPDMIEEAKKAGAIAGKVYPQEVITNSQDGITNFETIYPAIERMQKLGMLLLLHGEDPWEKITCLDRERVFLPTLFGIANNFPQLKIVLEHITTEAAVNLVESLSDNVAATITPHHLVLTIDDVIENFTHNFCKPIAKMPADRTALLKAATSGNPKFFFGSDSAPHVREKKECNCGCAVVFNAPIALPLLVQIFEEQGALDKLENFVTNFGISFYNLQDEYTDAVILVKEDWIVPRQYNGIVPFMAGKVLHWKIGYAYQKIGAQ